MQSRVFIVANRLPVSAHQTSHGVQFQPSPGGLASALRGVTRNAQAMWVGYAGVDLHLSEAKLQASGLPKNAIPLQLPADDYDDFYYKVANGSLWPVFHGFAPRKLYSQTQWKAFLRVTERFADKLAQLVHSSDIIWVHDYQLCMLPSILRKKGIQNKIGFFLHIPFPNIKTLQMIPHYRDILQSLCAADVTGFQTKHDVTNFQKALDFAAVPKGHTVLKALPVGIDYETYAEAHKQPAVRKQAKRIFNAYRGKTVVFSISRLDYTKGILQQLDAFERILKDSDDPGQFVYQLTVAPSRENLDEYSSMHTQIERRVAQINARWQTDGWRPVEFAYRNFPFEEVTAWYLRADIMLVSPLKDGMNLIAKEYVATRPENDGVLVLSRQAGAAEQLHAALLCEAHDVDSIVSSLQKAAGMTRAQKERAMSSLRKHISEYNATAWAANFLHHLDFEVK
jgi:trehalose 6-phosphate synthase/phosphatase